MTEQAPSSASVTTLHQWLDRLILADPDERRMISIEGIDAGHAHRRVICTRHDNLLLNWLSAFSHLDRTEASHRLHAGRGARLHQPGDIRPAWRTSRCTACRRTVIWATTVAGNAMPIDPEPTGSGHVQLISSSTNDDRPLALILRTDHERDSATGPKYSMHATSCTPPRSRKATS